MADNIELDAGTGGAVIKTDDDGTAHWQYVKVAFGADNTQTIVTSSTGLPIELLAGTATIGKLAANSGVDIGDVDVTTCGTITPGIAALNLGKAEDAAHSTGDVGIMSLSVRKNTAASTSGADGDYQPLITDTNGRLHVLDANTATIASDTTSIDGKITACNTGAVVISSGTITTITNDVSIDDGGNSITVDWNGTTPPIGAGTEATALRVTVATDSTGVLSIDDNGSSLTVDNSGTFATQVDGDALTALQLIDNPVVAHDAAVSGSTGVNMTGALATNSIEGLTQVANADATRVTADLNGCIVNRNATTLEELISGSQSNTDGSEDAVTNFPAGGAGIHNYITSVTVFNAHASTNGFVELVDGTGGTTIWVFPAPATGGTTHNFDPPLKQTTANTGLFFDPSAAITTIYISINGFQAQG